MGIGVSIFLLALGAILAFAVDANFTGLDVPVVGYILMLCGALGLLITMLMLNRDRHAHQVTEERVIRDRDVY